MRVTDTWFVHIKLHTGECILSLKSQAQIIFSMAPNDRLNDSIDFSVSTILIKY